MKKLVTSIALMSLMSVFQAAAPAAAQEGEEHEGLAAEVHHAMEAGHYPILKPRNQSWSFAGPFGKYDKGQLQRGLKIYKEVCSACHSMQLVAFRTLGELGYSEEQVKAFAGEYEVQDGPNGDGDMFNRKAVGSDYFPSPFANPEAAAASNNGAAPPDMSLLAKARGVERGFPTFIFDIFTQYQEGGPDYIYSLLTGYQEPPEGVTVPEGTHFNPYFAAAPSLAMAPPLSDGVVTYDDGSPETVDQYAHDVSAFLMWAAEPHLEERKRTGFMVMVFLLIFSALLYLTKKSVYSAKEAH
ncbi:cytochrome c1 [Rhizobium halophytocola]|uniref:Cytochrome c1 n=1 Tax=Rhizobium halophytocola TaxID=735519 RepID=A0ABS4E3S2_9HYPH|nr:cytochrome c1 [Rhizobium halophytocola]MBP1852588.1 ubiquinol-cytochrome c reductase cytochrome c1 subunit [Rhizobium halophytocola]